jgi:hypothetical protein
MWWPVISSISPTNSAVERAARAPISFWSRSKGLAMKTAFSRRMALAFATAIWVGSSAVAMAAPEKFTVPLTGAQQVPPVTTSGTGNAALTYDPATRMLSWDVTFSGLSSAATMAHFHGPATEGKNAGVLVWISKKGTPPSSPMTGETTLTPDQAKQFAAGEWYVNVHSKDHPSGELRGQVMPPKD